MPKNAVATNQDPYAADREALRRYFDQLWSLPPAEHGSSNGATDFRDVSFPAFWPAGALDEDPSPAATPESLPFTNPKGKIMSAIKVTNQILINGQPASKMTDEALFDTIAEAETQIERLQAIKNKPQALLRQIEEAKVGICKLVEYMDRRDASRTAKAAEAPAEATPASTPAA